MPLDYEFLDRMPTMAEMANGQSIIDTTSRGGRLTEYLKYNGQIFTQDFTSLSSQAQQSMYPGMNETSSGFESDAGTLEWDGEDDIIRVYDGDSPPHLRIKFGNLGSDEYGLQLYDQDGDRTLAKFEGDNAHIGNWWINENYIQGDGSSGASASEYIKLDSGNRRVEIKDASNVRVQLGKIESTAEYGLKLWDNTGLGVLAAIHGSTATIAGWTLGTSSFTSGTDADFVGISTSYGIQMGDSTHADAPFTVTVAGVLKAESGTIANWGISDSALSTGSYDTLNKMYFGTSGISLSDVFKVSSVGELVSESGSIGGWHIDASTLRSVDNSGLARLELNKTNNRIGVWGDGAGNEIVAMGYLDGLQKNIIRGFMTDRTINTMTDSTATWATNEHAGSTITPMIEGGASRTVSSNTATVITVNSPWSCNDGDPYEISDRGDYGEGDYGFWAKPGDSLFIDGDVQYNNGDWIISHDASYLVQNSDSTPKTIIRLGTDTGEKGLFLYETDGTTIAKFHSGGFTMGSMGGSDNYIDFDTVSGTLAVKGSITIDESSLDLNDNYVMHQLRLVLNVRSDDGALQNGEFAIVLRGADNSPTYGSSGTFTWKGTEYTLPYNEQDTDITCHTNVANKKGYICYETDGGGDAFEVQSTDTDLAFVYLDGSTWMYDKNNTAPATFVPTETMVALGHIHTGASTDSIAWGNLFEPRQLLDINTQVSLTSSGMKLKNAAGTTLAEYTSYAKIAGNTGFSSGTYCKITNTAMEFYVTNVLNASFGASVQIGADAADKSAVKINSGVITMGTSNTDAITISAAGKPSFKLDSTNVDIFLGENIIDQGSSSQDDIIMGSWATQASSAPEAEGILVKHGANDYTQMGTGGFGRNRFPYGVYIYSGLHNGWVNNSTDDSANGGSPTNGGGGCDLRAQVNGFGFPTAYPNTVPTGRALVYTAYPYYTVNGGGNGTSLYGMDYFWMTNYHNTDTKRVLFVHNCAEWDGDNYNASSNCTYSEFLGVYNHIAAGSPGGAGGFAWYGYIPAGTDITNLHLIHTIGYHNTGYQKYYISLVQFWEIDA